MYLTNPFLALNALGLLLFAQSTSNTYHFDETSTGGDNLPAFHSINRSSTGADGSASTFTQTSTSTPGLTNAPITPPSNGPVDSLGPNPGKYVPFGFQPGYNTKFADRISGTRGNYGC